MADTTENKKQQSEEEVLTPEKIEQASQELQQKRLEEMELRKKWQKDQTFKDSEWTKANALGGIKSRFIPAYSGNPNTQSEVSKAEEEKIKNSAQKPKGPEIDINTMKDSGEFATAQEATKASGLYFETLKWTDKKQTYEAIAAAERAKQDLKKTIADGIYLDYWLADGKLDINKIAGRVDEKIKKPNTSRQALDELKSQGVTQVDMPEIPDNDKAALTDILVSTFADITKNIVGLAGGDAASSVAIASSQTAGEISGERVQAMIARDLANYEERKERVRLLNAELLDKHKNNIVAYTSEFEQRASAEERAYQALKLNALDMEYNRAMQVLSLKTDIEDQQYELGMRKEAAENQLAQFNWQGKQDTNAKNVELRMQHSMNLIRINNMREQAEELKKQGYMGLDKLAQSPGVMYAQDAGIELATPLRNSMMLLNQYKPKAGSDDYKIATAGNQLGMSYFDKVQDLVRRGDIDGNGAAKAINAALAMAQRGNIPKLGITDAEIKTIANAPITYSVDMDTATAQSLPMFAPTTNMSSVYFTNTLSMRTMGRYEIAAQSYGKLSKDERAGRSFDNAFVFGGE